MYKAKYYKNIESLGHQWQIIIWQDTDNEVTLTEIGPVLQGLRLSVQGEQADIETPIVKTSLTMVFVDAPDLNDPRKCGYWEEFYTSSATEYKVELYKDNVKEWTGYITPDSFAEDLQYRGSVSIIARDNLGALQDVQYNAATDSNDMITLFALINQAMQVISFPMQYSFPTGGARGRLHNSELEGFEENITEVMFNGSAFVGKTWQDAVEGALLATGMVVRYVGSNSYVVVPMRDIPLYNKDYFADIPIVDVRFSAYGHRELNPAAKTLVDEVQFDIEENIASVDFPEESYGGKGEYIYRVESNPDEHLQTPSTFYRMPVYEAESLSWNTPSLDKSLFLNPFAYQLKEGYSSMRFGNLRATDVAYLASNAVLYDYDKWQEETMELRSVVYRMMLGKGNYRFSFKLDTPVSLYDNETKVGFIDSEASLVSVFYNLRYRDKYGDIITEYRLDTNKWEAGEFAEPNRWYNPNPSKVGLFPYVMEFPDCKYDVGGHLELEIKRINTYVPAPANARGAYVQIKEITIEDARLDTIAIPKSLKVTTNYNKNNNIRIHRNLEYGFNMGRISSPKTVKNGMYLLNNENWYQASDQWIFGYGDTPQPLSVLLHQQILAYYSKPNNLLTGELVVDNPVFNALYRWKGKNHIITSGTLNVLSGRMENVTLREFARYDSMWETYAEQDVFKVDYPATTIQVRVHSNKALTTSHLVLPWWIDGSIADAGNGVYNLTLHITQNDTGADRVAIIEVDTALVKVEQVIAGDYGIDYGFDYS